MSASIPIDGSKVIAGVTTPTSKAAFNRAQLIVHAGEGTLVRAQTYTSEGRVEGPALTMGELQGLIAAGHAIGLSASIPAVSGACLWVLRRALPHRDRMLRDLRLSGLLVHSPLVGQDGASLCVVKEGQPEASAILDRWREESMAEAMRHAKQGQWDLSTVDAEVAQAVCRGLDADVLAFLSLSYECVGRAQRATGLLEMARRSRGQAFEAQIASTLRLLREVLVLGGGSARVWPHAGLHAALRHRFPIAARELGKSTSPRLAPAA